MIRVRVFVRQTIEEVIEKKKAKEFGLFGKEVIREITRKRAETDNEILARVSQFLCKEHGQLIQINEIVEPAGGTDIRLQSFRVYYRVATSQ